MQKSLGLFSIILFVSISCNSDLSIDQGQKSIGELDSQIENIISNLSIEEKVGQTCQITLDAILKKDENGLLLNPIEIDSNKLSEALKTFHIGSILNVGWCTLGLEDWKMIQNKLYNAYQNKLTSVPVIYGIDAIHGANYTIGATLFPQEIGIAATWNREVAREFAEITAYETRSSFIPWNFSPVLDLGRQPLWSRNFETLGEDTYLASELGSAIIKGYQGDSTYIDDTHVVACLKHFVGYSGSKSGRDRTNAWIPRRYMHELYLPTFKKAVEDGALTVMINSGTVNGIPGHRNKYLLTDLLKDQWGFKGFTVSDWEDFIMLHTIHKTDSSLKAAYVNAFNAGVDMSMVPLSPQYKEYCELMVEAVNEGLISIERLDDAVRRILYVKLKAKLFDDPITNKSYESFGSQTFKEKSLNAALESITLLKNDSILPLKGSESILIAGPTADNLIFLNGAWTHTWQGTDAAFNSENCRNILEAFQTRNNGQTLFSKGAELYLDNHFEKSKFINLNDYNSKLNLVDVVILCLGEMPSTEKPGDIHSLNMNSEQLELAKMAYQKNKKVILVLTEGRPRIIREIVNDASAIIQCYLPGDYGAEALVKLIYGDQNFSGRLPYTYPKYDGCIEFYDHEFSTARDNNGGLDAFDPQWEFGHGLSYSNVKYTNLKLNTSTFKIGQKMNVSVDVTNTSEVDCKEVIQLYLSDDYASISPANKKLIRFDKIALKAGETKTINFNIQEDDLSFMNEDGIKILENGTFTIKIDELTSTFNYHGGTK